MLKAPEGAHLREKAPKGTHLWEKAPEGAYLCEKAPKGSSTIAFPYEDMIGQGPVDRKYTDSLMDPLVSNTVFRPPVLDGSNYALWKVNMRMYIKSIEERVWQRVLDGWSPPKIVDDDGDCRSKPESSWSNDEVQTSNFNSKALNAIFTSVDINMFCLITNCISAKEAWDILQKQREGSESVRRTKLRMLTSKFESLRMEENETIMEYDRRLREIANEAFNLSDSMSNERLVSKVLRSLPERFNIKICAIDESKDTSKLNLEDLISSLRTFEMNLDLQKGNTRKAIALQSTDDSVSSLIQEAKDSDLGEESISLITKKFGDYLKRMSDKKKTGSTSRPQFVPNKTSASTQGNSRFRTNSSGRPEATKLDSVQCRECSGFGHYANECANRLRRNKNMAVSLIDDDTDEECNLKEGADCTSLSAIQNDIYKLQVNPFGVAAGVAKLGRNTLSRSLCLNAKSLENIDDKKIHESDQEELTIEIVQMMYEELYGDWLKRNETNSILSKENIDLKSSLTRLEVLLSKKDLELCRVKDELDKASKTLAKFNSSTSKLDTVLNMGKEGRFGLGYTESTYEYGGTSHTESKNTVFVKGVEDCTVPSISDPIAPNTKPIIEQEPHSSIPDYSPSKDLPSSKKSQTKNKVHGTLTVGAHPVLQHFGTTRCLELLHMDLMGPMDVESLGGKKYSLVYVDDFSRFTWISFIREKSDTFGVFKKLHARITNLHDEKVVRIRTDHGKEFENSLFTSLCEKKGISHEFSAPKTPQQNGIAERKNRTLQEMARVMLSSKNVSKRFWAEALNTACHISNHENLKRIEGLVDSSELSTSTGVEVSVETNEATPCTTPPINRYETMENENDEDDGIIETSHVLVFKMY
ncbi:uncharacterized protein [Primulina eburnea]|uniref:uncharacterized protein n=1 Tax=Primulina eburnea TaxID=1245227 RepID=UPI003C6CBBE7